MLSFAPNIRIFLHARPTDMRKSFDGLCGLVRGVLAADPLDGSLFLFVNRRGDRLKALWWDHDGLALFYKRLEPEDALIFGFTELRRHAYNWHVGIAEAGRMVGISHKPGSRRSIMSGQGGLSVPPRPDGRGNRSARPTLDAASTGEAATGAANSDVRGGSANRAASEKGGGR